MSYTITTQETGFTITHPHPAAPRVSVTLHATGLLLESSHRLAGAPFGLFDYYRLSQCLTSALVEDRFAREPAWKQRWLLRSTGRRLGRQVHQQWRRLLALADPTVVAVQRAVFAATFRAPSVLFMEELYAQRWLVRDIVSFRAAAVAVALLQYLSERDDDRLGQPAAPPLIADEAELAGYLGSDVVAAELLEQGCYQPCRAERPLEGLPHSRPAFDLARLNDWRGLFSKTGKSYRSLNKTLLRLPRLPLPLLARLRAIALERPITSRIELLLLLTHAENYEYYGDRRQHMRLYMHACEADIVEAMRRVARETRNFLNPRKWRDMQVLVQYLNDYDQEHRGTIVGLADKSISWHREVRNRTYASLAAAYDPLQPAAAPPIHPPSSPHIRWLATVGEVLAEGLAMRHCIATYARQAVLGGCYLFHVEWEGQQASVQVSPGGRVVQSYGPGNEKNAAAEWAERELNRWGAQFPPPEPGTQLLESLF